MTSLCKVQLIGNLGGDPEVRYTQAGGSVTQFSLAVGHGKQNKTTGEWDNTTDWFRVTVWGKRGEAISEQLRKGNRAYVEGRFETRAFQDKNGVDRTSMDVTADTIIGLDKTPGEGALGSQGSAQPAGPADDTDIADLPF
jgi:single-strand DNA-binding protein